MTGSVQVIQLGTGDLYSKQNRIFYHSVRSGHMISGDAVAKLRNDIAMQQEAFWKSIKDLVVIRVDEEYSTLFM